MILKLPKGQKCLVDDEDYFFIAPLKWFAVKNRNTFYVVRHTYKNGKRTVQHLHRFLMGEPQCQVDHVNRNGLDNQKHNLRLSDVSKNARNASLAIDNKSGFKGVKKHKYGFTAQINKNGKQIYLGNFKDPKAAAERYDREAELIYGEFACTNKDLGLL